MKLEEEKSSAIKSFIRSSFSSKKSLKKHLIEHSKTSSLDSSSALSSTTTPSSSTSTSSLSLNESNAENSDVFFGEGMSVVFEAEKADATRKNNMILESREAASSKEKFNKKSGQTSDSDSREIATPSTNYFRPKIQKLGEKLKTLIAPREQQHFVHFRRLFDSYIPEGDNLIMTFPCSYQSKIKDFPLHGRMYLTLSMIGFSSSLFGYEKKIIIHLRDITSLKKDRSSRFSINSIKIVTQSGEKHCFGSLKSRDRIYSLLFRVLRMNVDPNNRDTMIEDDDELDQLKAGDNNSVAGYRISDNNQMTASDTSSEGSDENSYTSTVSNVPPTTTITTELPTTTIETFEPVIPVECQCREHKGRKLLDIEIPLTIEQTFKLLFNDNEWLNKFEISLKRSENKCTSWNEDENTGKKERVCVYTMELDKTFGPKSTKITETQICNPITSYSEGYTVIKEAINEGVPYCDSFSVECVYCVTKVSETKSRLKVHGGITFKKYIFGLIKGVIERSAITGLDQYYNALSQKLKSDEEQLLSFITEMDLEDIPIIADETLIDNGITASNYSETPALNNRFADRVVSMSVLKEANVSPPAATTTSSSTTSESSQSNDSKTVILLLKIIAVLLFFIFISNIWFNISNRHPQTIPSGPSVSSMEELTELRKMVVSLESKFNTFLTGAKKEL